MMATAKEYPAILAFASLWLLCTWGSASAAVVARAADERALANITIKHVEKEVEALIASAAKMALPYFVRNSDLNLSSSCMSTFIKIFVDVRKLKVPAIKLMDAMAKPPSALLKGHFAIMGDYDECLEVSSTKKGEVPLKPEDEYYHGQYCTVEVGLPPQFLDGMVDYAEGTINYTEFGKLGNIIKEMPAMNFARNYFKFQVGICLPSTCTVDDLTNIVGLVPVDFLSLNTKRCEDGRNIHFNLHQVIFLIFLAVMAVLVLYGTAVDGWVHLKPALCGAADEDFKEYKEKSNKFIQFLLSFSIYSNTRKMLSTEKTGSSDITVINGMYVTGTILVVIYHTYFLPFFPLFSSYGSNLGAYLQDIQFTLLVTMGISIEAYFLFSGIVLVYPRFRRGQKHVNVNIIKIIVRRYIRLCPSLLFILGVIVALPLIGSGPVFADIFEKAAENTRKWWWTYALMFNNFLEVKDQNFLYLWFIPCLMQISIIGAFLLWILAKCPKFGIFLTIATGLACNIALGVLTAIRHYPPTYAVYYYHNREHYEEAIYTSPLSHMFSYGIGMMLGYFMAKHQKLTFSKVHVVIGWIVSLLLTVGVQFIAYAGRGGTEPDPILAAIYAATHRTAFSLGMSWIILACTHGYGGVLTKILCWKAFGPLSKLGYFAYLIHYIVITFHVSMARSSIAYSHYEIWMRICSYVVLTFIAAYLLYITFELPLTFVESLFLPVRKSNSHQEDQLQANQNDAFVPDRFIDTLTPGHLTYHNGKSPYYNGNISGEHSRL